MINLNKYTTCFPKILFLFLTISLSCTQQDEDLYAENVPVDTNLKSEYTGLLDYLTDIGTVNIDAFANANHPGSNDLAYIKNINNPNFGYCHPDVQYFPNGFNGYKYWMVFTPYFGSVGNVQISKRYENPTIVVSNDGINWSGTGGTATPLQMAPSTEESFAENQNDPKQGFWSDVDWTYEKGKFSLYYRGSFIKASALKKRGAKSVNNFKKLGTNAQRTIVRQTSTNGINWSKLEVAYTSNKPYSPKDNHIISPSIVYNGSKYISYEVENNISNNFPGNDPSYIIRRTSDNGLDFSNFQQSKVVNFINKPWLTVSNEYAPWHLQATYVDGYYFLCLAVGEVKKCTAEALYLAFSKDGSNFKVFPKPLAEHNAYRSCIFPMQNTAEKMNFGAIVAFKSGVFKYREFQLDKSKLDACFTKQ